jgi:hypothetical protein
MYPKDKLTFTDVQIVTDSSVIHFATLNDKGVVLKVVKDSALAQNEITTLNKISKINCSHKLLDSYQCEIETTLVFPLLNQIVFKTLDLVKMRNYLGQICRTLVILTDFRVKFI